MVPDGPGNSKETSVAAGRWGADQVGLLEKKKGKALSTCLSLLWI